MHINIDWLSFTLKNNLEPITNDDLINTAQQLLRKVSGEHERIIFESETYRPRARGRSYRLAVANVDNGITLYGGGTNQSILLELSGKGCAKLGDWQQQSRFVAAISKRITRLDFACDMEVTTRPVDFQNAIKSERFRSRSVISSDTGETVYVGSAKSDRFLRVYRYNPPHPRANLLRAEFVFKSKMARAAADDMFQSEAGKFAARLGNSFELEHPDWKPGSMTQEKIRTVSIKRKDEDTIAWLYKQVIPAITRLISEGAIDFPKLLLDEFGITVIDPPTLS